jgi:hypothetical protein
MAAIRYTSKEVPLLFVGRFDEVHEMINAFKEHYSSQYKPLWLNCINELMNSWVNKFCPGLMSLPCKPHPFGNEYFLIATGDGGKPIIWQIRIVRGEDWPRKLNGTFAFPTKSEKKGFTNTIELLMDMKEPIHHMGKVVTGDNSFCVPLGVTALHQHGVHIQFLIKKHCYCLKYIPGDLIGAYMMTKLSGAMERFLQELGGLRFFVNCTCNADYIT